DILTLSKNSQTNTKIFVATFETNEFSFNILKSLRDAKIPSEINLETNIKIDKQLKYADKKGIPYVAIIGPDEIKNNTVTLKDLLNQKQETLSVDQLILKLKDKPA
ncbi:hypothetical protein HYT02_01460, partial [Candidatus Gottesmanbacteria bacterium]|nr:hypothetical protein [Candidatus Gottesmanbacteria bacterium]